MRRLAILGGTAIIVLALVIVVLVRRELERGPAPIVPDAPLVAPPAMAQAGEQDQGFLYGRITTPGGASYEGRLRFGGREEAFWGDFFNGYKTGNRWLESVAPEELEEERAITVFGLRVGSRTHRVDTDRPFMARFGDIARIEARGKEIVVTLKSGTSFSLDRNAADDLADGVRVWDLERGLVDLDERRIRSIELLPTPALGAFPERLHGSVRTRGGTFRGFLQWNRALCVATDTLFGRSEEAEIGLRFEEIAAITKESGNRLGVTLTDGREFALSASSGRGFGERGVYVDDPRYGRVLVSWEVLERVEFSAAESGPAYDAYLPGRRLAGSVLTREGRRLEGEIVFDLDESETTETLDAPAGGVHYTIPFGLIASIVPSPRRSLVTLRGGEGLELESSGDLDEKNAGLLVFVEEQRAEYLRWRDVRRIDFVEPGAMYPRDDDEAR